MLQTAVLEAQVEVVVQLPHLMQVAQAEVEQADKVFLAEVVFLVPAVQAVVAVQAE
jgi:hypothetical protein